MKSNRPPSPLYLLNHVLKSHIYTFFEHLLGWQLHHFPGQPVPMPDHSFSEELFPNIQSKPALMQLDSAVPAPTTWSMVGNLLYTAVLTERKISRDVKFT